MLYLQASQLSNKFKSPIFCFGFWNLVGEDMKGGELRKEDRQLNIKQCYNSLDH